MSCLLCLMPIHDPFMRKIMYTVRNGVVVIPSIFASLFQRENFPAHINHRTDLIENQKYSAIIAQSSTRTRLKTGFWCRGTTNVTERFHGNVPRCRSFSGSTHFRHLESQKISKDFGEMKENKIFTVPNILCFGRILASPVLGYFVLLENYLASLTLFVAAGFTDMLDGFIARRFPSQMSYLGSVLDPIADKILVGVLTVTMSVAHLIPVPLAIIILGRDLGLVAASFAVRFISLPPPRTLSRYFNFNLPTVQVTPSITGKVSTALQLALISLSLAAPILDFSKHLGLLALQYTVGFTTIVSGLDYVITRRGFSILRKKEH